MRLPTWLSSFDLGAEDADPVAQTRWAAAGLGVLGVILAIVAGLYLHPPGTSSYALELPESGGLAAGDEVRIAGVPVGSVSSIALDGDHVDVTFTVDSRYTLGDRTTVSVRMLTPIGGLYLALHPAGEEPLRGPIPAERANLPFLMGELFDEADAVFEQLDPQALRTALDRTAAALTESPDAIGSTVVDLEAVIQILAAQRTQIEDLLALSNEYLSTANANQELALEIIRGYAVLGPKIIAARDDVKIFADALSGLAGLVFDFLSGPYAEKVEPLLGPIEQAADESKELSAQVESMMNSMTTTLDGLAQIAGPEGQVLIDQSKLTVSRPDACLPMPGTRC
ncbi:MAG TPA: MlaD family protein [Nocardia sp.]|uniref:MlaD family protein n=1 Tax=Nocardia TaxID=1817 RepID=UPI0024569D24|nr:MULTISPECIES: MlaD family protein [Nocardia]HLS78394.1 MlaD family protein [Nocardia sp.]